jgi:hypothetical protein
MTPSHAMHSALVLSPSIGRLAAQQARRPAARTAAQPGTDAPLPWELTPYLSKKKGRPMDAQGNIIDSLENTADWFTWTPDTKLRMAADSLSNELGKTSDELLAALQALETVIPGGAPTLQGMKAGDAVRLAAVADAVPARLIEAREALPPGVDAARVVAKWPEALLLPPGGVAAGFAAVAEQFEAAVGPEGVAAMVETTPQLLDSEVLRACFRGAGHLMPLAQLASSLARYEDYWMQFQSLEKEPRNDYDELLKDDNYYQQHGVTG